MAEGRKQAERPIPMTLLATYHLLLGAVCLTGPWLAVTGVARPKTYVALAPLNIDKTMATILTIGVTTVCAYVSLMIGLGLLQRLRWARWSAIALGLVALPVFPLGTAIGSSTVIYLLSRQGRQVFARRT